MAYDQTRGELDSFLNSLKGMNSAFGGISGASDVAKRYGLGKGSRETFDPLKRSLASQTNRAMAGATLAGGRNATPGMTFSSIKSNSNNALSNLLSEQGRTDSGERALIAQLLHGVFGGRDSFALGKAGLEGNTLSNMANLDLQEQMSEDSEPGFWDYLMGSIPSLAAIGLSPMSGGGSLLGNLFSKSNKGTAGPVTNPSWMRSPQPTVAPRIKLGGGR